MLFQGQAIGEEPTGETGGNGAVAKEKGAEDGGNPQGENTPEDGGQSAGPGTPPRKVLFSMVSSWSRKKSRKARKSKLTVIPEEQEGPSREKQLLKRLLPT